MPAGPFVWAVWSLYETTIAACLIPGCDRETIRLEILWSDSSHTFVPHKEDLPVNDDG